MADEIKEQKLAAARKKLRKYQMKKGVDKARLSVSPVSTTELEDQVINNLKSENSSRSSSVMDVTDSMKQEIKLSVQVDVNSSSNATEQGIQFQDYEISNCTANDMEEVLPAQVIRSFDCKPEEFSSESKLNDENNFTELGSSATEDRGGSISSETNVSMATVIEANELLTSQPHYSNQAIKSTSENLRQLSLQMSGLVNDVQEIEPSGPQLAILELEDRNSKLAAMLSNEKQLSTQQSQLIEELRTRLAVQDSQIQTLQSMAMAGSNDTEVTGLREQLQVHIQTIGILVAEKSELQSSLANARHSLELKCGEVTDLQGRLEASRQRVVNFESTTQKLEKQLSTISVLKDNKAQQLINLHSGHANLNKMCEELKATVAELSERLAVKSEENRKLSGEGIELRRELHLAQIRVQQLNDDSLEDLRTQLEHLQLAYQESQNQISLSKDMLEKAYQEKTQLEDEYKAYVKELSKEVEELRQKLNSEILSKQELQQRIEEMEKKFKLEEVKSEYSDESEKSTLMTDIEKYKLENAELEKRSSSLEERCSSLARDNGQLSQLLSEQSSRLESLEAASDRSSANKVDTSQLLQTMQSDKIAAARALTQNKQLKEQLEELQNGFIMMSNKKLELTEKLEKELHIKKALHQEVSKLSEELTSHKKNILEQKREIASLRGGLKSPVFYNKSAAINENNKIKMMEQNKLENHNDSTVHQHTKHDDKDTMAVTHSPPTEDIPPLSQNGFSDDTPDLEDDSKKSNGCSIDCREDGANEQSLKYVDDKYGNQYPIDSRENSVIEQPQKYVDDKTSELEYSEVSLKAAHKALEMRFLICMRDLATLSEEKQNLEHVVQQLQVETETVGDYITIYQFQRGVMKQQMQEMKSELELLKIEKDETISRFSKLQNLFMTLSADDRVQEGVLTGFKNILDNSSSLPKEESDEVPLSASQETSPLLSSGSGNYSNDVKEPKKTSNKETVKQIINLISEMETSNQMDFTALHKFHPCSHCSGKLITI